MFYPREPDPTTPTQKQKTHNVRTSSSTGEFCTFFSLFFFCPLFKARGYGILFYQIFFRMRKEKLHTRQAQRLGVMIPP